MIVIQLLCNKVTLKACVSHEHQRYFHTRFTLLRNGYIMQITPRGNRFALTKNFVQNSEALKPTSKKKKKG